MSDEAVVDLPPVFMFQEGRSGVAGIEAGSVLHTLPLRFSPGQ